VLKEKGARRIFACASHGLFHGTACEKIASSVLDCVFVTDSVCIRKKMSCEKVKVVSIARLIAEAVRRMYHGESLSTLFTVESV
jgi:ribose-phosphate pyrophosphokinase